MTEQAQALSCETDTEANELEDREKLALLCRILVREGYDDHLAGHITALQPDGTLLVNPFGMRWDEVCAGDILRIDKGGKVIEGKRPVNPGVALHLALHEARDDVRWIVHNHPRWGTIWAGAHRTPPAYDQSSSFCGHVGLVHEYEGAVNDPATAKRMAEEMGDANVALLVNHGVLVLGSGAPQVLTMAISLERRCRNAWHVEALGGGFAVKPEVQRFFSDALAKAGFPGLWETLVRRELRYDRSVLDTAD
jgi:ribulose-5-phosphate 4-epimerase/fuculose-1-phosphate aldolase